MRVIYLKVAQIIHEQMFIVFPALRVIYDYFMEMTRIMVKLNLPISWITPAGLRNYTRICFNLKNIQFQ